MGKVTSSSAYDIMDVVARKFKIESCDLPFGRSREKRVAIARAIAIRLTREKHPELGDPEIATLFECSAQYVPFAIGLSNTINPETQKLVDEIRSWVGIPQNPASDAAGRAGA
jgi:hypothetical protein